MWSWLWSRSLLRIVLFVVGGWLIVYGVLIEVTVREELGGGLSRFLGKIFYDDTIREYREESRFHLVLGPVLVLVGLLAGRRRRRPVASTGLNERSES